MFNQYISSIVEVRNDQNVFTESNLGDWLSSYVRWSFLRTSCSCSIELKRESHQMYDAEKVEFKISRLRRHFKS